MARTFGSQEFPSGDKNRLARSFRSQYAVRVASLKRIGVASAKYALALDSRLGFDTLIAAATGREFL